MKTWFGPESKALQHYSSGWFWRFSFGAWELIAPHHADGGRIAAAVYLDGLWAVYDPAQTESWCGEVTSEAHVDKWSRVTAAMSDAIDCMIKNGCASSWGPEASVRPLLTVNRTDSDMIEIGFGAIQIDLTKDEALGLASKIEEETR